MQRLNDIGDEILRVAGSALCILLGIWVWIVIGACWWVLAYWHTWRMKDAA